MNSLPIPSLCARPFGARAVFALTDDALFDACGVRIAFTSRHGGVSAGQYDSLNLGHHVGDNLDDVMQNRAIVLEALVSDASADTPVCVVPNQVHGDELVSIDAGDAQAIDTAQEQATKGADGIVISTSGVAAMLCFADCVPVIIAAPDGRFAVVHAGWRGVENEISTKALKFLCGSSSGQQAVTPADCNIYIGPHIGVDHFEVSEELRDHFAEKFGAACVTGASDAPADRHVDLSAALRTSLTAAGAALARIVDAGICTQCTTQDYFSYRATDGACGRHGAIAFRTDNYVKL